MNEFTKEELEDMLNWGDVYTEFGYCWSYKIHKPLLDKIKYMIDHYQEDSEKCEHGVYERICFVCAQENKG